MTSPRRPNPVLVLFMAVLALVPAVGLASALPGDEPPMLPPDGLPTLPPEGTPTIPPEGTPSVPTIPPMPPTVPTQPTPTPPTVTPPTVPTVAPPTVPTVSPPAFGPPIVRATLEPSFRSADAAAEPAPAALRLAFALPGAAVPAAPAGTVYDRIVFEVPDGFAFDVAGVIVAGRALENRTGDLQIVDCAFNAAADHPGWATRGLVTSTGAFYVCRDGDVLSVTLSNPARDPTAAVVVSLSGFSAPTVASVYAVPVTLHLTASGVDSAVGAPLDLPRSTLLNTQLAPFTVTPGALAGLDFTTKTATLDANSTFRFNATATDQFGNDRHDIVAYSVATGSGGIDSGGNFTPALVGTTVLRATDGALTATTSVAVTPGALHHVDLAPASRTLDADTPLQLSAVARDAKGNARGDPIAWTVTGSGAVTQTGLFTPQLTGATTVRAAVGAVGANSTITVTPGAFDRIVFTSSASSVAADATQLFAAQARDAKSNVRPDAITLSLVSGPGELDAGGTFTPDLVGTSVVRAATAGGQAEVTIATTPGVLHHVDLVPEDPTTNADTPVQFTAVARDVKGNARADAIAWTLTGSGTLTQSGLFTPALTGTQSVRAAVGAVGTTTTTTVAPGAFDRIVFTRSMTTVAADATAVFAAVARDAEGNARPDAITFSLPSGPGSIGADGTFTPDLVGTSTVRATSANGHADATVTTTTGALHHYVVACDTPVLVGESASCTAAGEDVKGNPRTEAPGSWSATRGTLGSCSPCSSITWTAPSTPGTATITASNGNANGATTVTVIAGDVATIDVTSIGPFSVSADAATFSVSATLRDQGGNPVADGTVVTWTALDPSPANSATAPVLGTSTTTNGVATLTVSTSRVAGDDYRVKASYVDDDVELISRTSQKYTVVAGALHHLNVAGFPSNATAGGPFTDPVAVSARDAFGNLRADAATIHLSTASPGATLPADAPLVAGSRTFPGSGFTLVRAGTATITATVPGASGASGPIAVAPGPLGSVAFIAPPTTTDADTPVPFVAGTLDAFGNARSGDNVMYGVLSGSGSVNATSGAFTPDKVGTTIVRASSGAFDATTPISVNAGAAVSIAFVDAPNATSADAPVTFVARALDARNNTRTDGIAYAIDAGTGSIGAASGVFTPAQIGVVKVNASASGRYATTNLTVSAGPLHHATLTAASPTIDADHTVALTPNGFDVRGNPVPATFVFSLVTGTGSVSPAGIFSPDKVGTPRLRAASGDVAATVDVQVTPGVLAAITFANAPTTTTADQAQTFSAIPRDAHGNVVTASVTYALDGASTGTIDANGVFTPDKIGAVIVNASRGAFFNVATIQVAPGAPASATIRLPESATAGVAFGANATIVDAHGNPAGAGAAATLELDDATFATATITGGLADFPGLRLTRAGSALFALRVDGIVVGTAAVPVVPAPAASYSLACAGPCAPTAGAPLALALTALDSFGNVATSYTGEHDVTFSGPLDAPDARHARCEGVDVGGRLALTFASGAASASCTLVRVGAQTLTATNDAFAPVSLALTTAPGPAAAFAIDAPTTATAGSVVNVTVRALDTYGNAATGYAGAKPLVWSGAADAPDGTRANATDPAGARHSFGTATNATFTAGTAMVAMTLYARDAATLLRATHGAITGASAPVQVGAAAVAQMGITTCSPSLGSHACVVLSESVTRPLALTLGQTVSFFAATFDTYDNVVGGTSGAWLGDGTAAGLVANGAGVTWAFEEAGDASIRLTHTQLGTRTLDITINGN